MMMSNMARCGHAAVGGSARFVSLGICGSHGGSGGNFPNWDDVSPLRPMRGQKMRVTKKNTKKKKVAQKALMEEALTPRPFKENGVTIQAFNLLKRRLEKQNAEINKLRNNINRLLAASRQRPSIQVVLVDFDQRGRFKKLNIEEQKVPDSFYNFLKNPESDSEKVEKTETSPATTKASTQPEELEKSEKHVQNDIVFKQIYFNGLSLNMGRMETWIKDHFLINVCAKYDWFALWRIMQEKGFLKDYKTSKFVEQMELWFGKEQMKGVAAAINLYRSGYLGNYHHDKWDYNEFAKGMKGKQSKDGFNRLLALCMELNETLNIDDFLTKKS